ncbi:MAG: hypothetical protein ACRD2L_19285, partial [Terriglobia bacterium]
MLDDVISRSLTVRADALPEASSSSVASRSASVRIEGLKGKRKVIRIPGASLASEELDSHEKDIARCMT